MSEKLTEKTLENFKEEKKDKVLGENTFTEEEIEIARRIYEEAKMPVELKDEDIVCGQGELDIRKLSDENKWQMLYRSSMLQIVYLRQVNSGLVDIMRLLIVSLKHQGVENVTKALEDCIEEMGKEIGKEG